MRETLIEQRSRTTVWIAERLEALSEDELLAPGALSGRDYGEVINLEEVLAEDPQAVRGGDRLDCRNGAPGWPPTSPPVMCPAPSRPSSIVILDAPERAGALDECARSG